MRVFAYGTAQAGLFHHEKLGPGHPGSSLRVLGATAGVAPYPARFQAAP